VSNKSIDVQIKELCRDARAAMADDCNHNVWAACELLRTDLKAIAGASCHDVIDRGVEALQYAAVWDDVDSALDAVLSIVRCIANDAQGKSISNSKFMFGVLSE